MKSTRQLQEPGDEPVKDGVTGLNNVRDDPNKVARDRESIVRGRAVGTIGEGADLAPPVTVGDGKALGQDATIAGQNVLVVVPKRVENPHVSKFGPESRLPRGTYVRKDGTPVQGDEKPYGIIGDVIVPNVGRLVNRVVPLEALGGDAA